MAFSGQSDGPPPDVIAGRYHPASNDDYNYNDNYSTGSTTLRRRGMPQDMSRRERRGLRREQRRGERVDRREDRRERRQRGRDERAVRDENWRLVISPIRPARANDILSSR